MNEKLFIGIGTWNYTYEPQLNVPELESSLTKVAELFTGTLGYKRALGSISANPTSRAIRDTLDAWLVVSVISSSFTARCSSTLTG